MAFEAGQQLGNYRVVRLLGQGGFAEVYLGEHIRLKMKAAIKVLHTHLSGEAIDAFQHEAQVIAELTHPNIVRVLDFDLQDGSPFLVLDYAPNHSLREKHPRGSCVPLAQVVSYVQQIASALQYAHERKLIHRDVKPENMLVGKQGEILLSDFGIVTMAHSTSSMNTQASMGTLAYMAPEQIQGKPRPASDQYALAIAVYQWLSGAMPFQGSSTEIIAQHLAVTPPPLSERVPDIPPGVEWVVMRALSKDPKERFGSVQAFARALEQAAEGLLEQQTAAANPPALSQTEAASSPRSKTPPAPNKTVPARQTKLPLVGTTLSTYRGHTDIVEALVWSPDGTAIASAGGDRTVHIWNALTGQLLLTYRGHSQNITAVAWSPDGRYIASGSTDNTVHVWQAATGQVILVYRGHSNSIWTLAWSPESDGIASGSDDQTVRVWYPLTGEELFAIKSSSIWALAWSPDDTYVAFVDDGQNVQVCNSADGEKICTYRGHRDLVFALSCSPDGSQIASGGDDGIVHVWHATTGRSLQTFRGHTGTICDIAWSQSGKYLATASEDQTVQIWATSTARKILTYSGHKNYVNAVAWSPDNRYVASASTDATVQVWGAPDSRVQKE
ncbi:hypothetical protein KSF_022880 [Reticulibacter mediterranei]|uniref:Protein kinase domain-containing protein n=1 Tax=Reticulibacter mediterranei TaxID=2778369 RepID=A0A8J3IGZ8_9CHLR|nr:serine/threonine-protein kinase [Reticulibacter mediterranei]GHO92240.1 hypothetical protein KSF_022880 [Reticulibacter mediterranei]